MTFGLLVDLGEKKIGVFFGDMKITLNHPRPALEPRGMWIDWRDSCLGDGWEMRGLMVSAQECVGQRSAVLVRQLPHNCAPYVVHLIILAR